MTQAVDSVVPRHILIVEDNPGYVRLINESFKELFLVSKLHVVSDGEKAMSFLRREGPYRDVPRPELILLDLNLPRKDGREVLRDIKQDPTLRRIPVVVLTSSNAEQDVVRAYDLHANCYVTKPFDFNQFIEVMRSIYGFWLTTVRLPQE